MTIEKSQNGTSYTLALSGRLDTTTAPQLEAQLKACFADASELTLDFKELDYISSAGLRVLLTSQKIMNKQGKMTLRHVGEAILEIFEMTGFINILDIKQ
ncbi:MAG: STAS domain-containing protein [Clostridiales bacterium]|nr:STAS domain-containing protein [Clostridiales bacterium]